jgi:hypothetical protein
MIMPAAEVANGNATGKPEPYDGGPWLGVDDIFAPLPDPEWMIPDLQFGPGRPATLAADVGSGKTVLAQDAALAVATGRPAWGWFRTRGPAKVRHADQDQGRGTLRRYQRLALGMGIEPGELRGKLEVASFPELYLTTTSDDVWLRACDGVGLMILDALRGFLPGVDENDSAVQAHLMRLAKISDRTGCTFLLLHHFGKAGRERKADINRLRGSTGIGAALGSVFVLEGDKNEPKRVSHVKGHPDGCGKMLDDFYIEIEDVPDGDRPHAGLRVVYRTAEEVNEGESPESRLADTCERVLDFVKSHPGSSGRLIRSQVNGARSEVVVGAIEELARRGRIHNTGTERSPKWEAAGSDDRGD